MALGAMEKVKKDIYI